MQQCYIVRQSYTYGENGDRINPGRVWDFVETSKTLGNKSVLVLSCYY
jgi:hypothetical protein